MRHFLKLVDGIDVVPALLQLHENEALWDEFTERRASPASPHREVSDLHLRYRDRAELDAPQRWLEPHFPVWYPAWGKLPALRPIVFGLMARCEATHLGGVLLTRIPPGGRVLPHDDRGSWHAEFHRCKVHVPLAANAKCVSRVEDEAVCMMPGSAWVFDNLLRHSVENDGDADRVTLIVSMRREV